MEDAPTAAGRGETGADADSPELRDCDQPVLLRRDGCDRRLATPVSGNEVACVEGRDEIAT